jgi:Viral coat protein P2 N-terminal domain
MNPILLPSFQTVASGATAVLRIPKYQLTLGRLDLIMGGTTFTKAQITEVRCKIGSRTVWTAPTINAVSGGQVIDQINQYKGIVTNATRLQIDFTERDFLNNVTREVGGWDMSKLSDEVFLEVVIAAGAVAPTLYAVGFFTPPQGATDDPSQAVQKMISVPFSYAQGGKFNLAFEPRGAIIKRAYVFFNGTDWTGVANGNVARIEVKKNSLVVFGELQDLDNRYLQSTYRKVPQSKVHVIDFVFDNNLSGGLSTADASSLEILATLTAADTGAMLVEVLDAPMNL